VVVDDDGVVVLVLRVGGWWDLCGQQIERAWRLRALGETW
jgi:hypothetical protein